VASFTSTCQKGNCTFDGSASRDQNGIASFKWNFGDGTSAVSAVNARTTHSYTQRGNYYVTVTLTVVNSAGVASSAQKSIQIRNNGKWTVKKYLHKNSVALRKRSLTASLFLNARQISQRLSPTNIYLRAISGWSTLSRGDTERTLSYRPVLQVITPLDKG